MLTDVIALDLIVRDRIHSRIAEADNDRLADQVPGRGAAPAAIVHIATAPFAAVSHTAASVFGTTLTAVRLSTAHALRGLAADIDPCAGHDAGFLIARSR